MVQMDQLMENGRGEVRDTRRNRMPLSSPDADKKHVMISSKEMRCSKNPSNESGACSGQDRDLANKNHCNEYLSKVEQNEPQEPLVSEEELNIDLRTPTAEKAGKTTKRDRVPPCLPRRLVITLLLAGFAVKPSESADLKLTSQILPQHCRTLFKHHNNDCPNDKFFDSSWEEFNTWCCGNYSGIFHCQIWEDKRLYSIPACLMAQTVPPGKNAKLVQNGTGYPELDLDADCAPGTYRDHSINSSYIRHPNCERKTKGNPEEEKWCDGGPLADDLFLCRAGFQAENCPHGHNSHDSCTCLPLQCPEGSHPFRDVTGNCSNNSTRVKYGCSIPVSTMTMTAPSHQSLSSGEMSSTTLPTGTDRTTTKSTPSSNQTGYIFLGVLGTLGGVIMIICLVRRFRKRRTESSNLPERVYWLDGETRRNMTWLQKLRERVPVLKF